MDADELLVPAGYQHLMLMAAYAKRGLQFEMKPGKRLKLLELLNSLCDAWFVPEMLAVITPAGDTEAAMIDEARSLDGDKGCEASFNVLTSPKVFGHFCKLNASFLAAIKIREQMTAAGKSPVQTF